MNGIVYEGKFSYGSFKTKIDKKTRNVVKLKPKTGFEAHSEIKGQGSLSKQWFEAIKNSSGTFELTEKGKKEMAAAKSAASSGGSSSSSSSGSGDSGGSGC